MKKLLAILLMFSMMSSLAGCGSKKDTEPTDDVSDTQTDVTNDDETVEGDPAE